MSLESDLAALREHWNEYDQFCCDERAGRYVAMLERERADLAAQVSAQAAEIERLEKILKRARYYVNNAVDDSDEYSFIGRQEAGEIVLEIDAALAALEPKP